MDNDNYTSDGANYVTHLENKLHELRNEVRRLKSDNRGKKSSKDELRRTYKTVLSKREHPSFGGKGLTDEKSPLNFLKTIFTPTHQFYPNQTIFPSISVDLVQYSCVAIAKYKI